MNILVTGGAGYVGSHAVRALLAAGHFPVVYDSLEHGRQEFVPEGTPLYVGNTGDVDRVRRVLKEREIDAVMHFAAYIEVGESMRDPTKYFRNNLGNALKLLEAMEAEKVEVFIFSSTAAVYGEPPIVPISETAPKNPSSVYGQTKWMVEETLNWLSQRKQLRYMALRYFNACGADPSGEIGEAHQPESHLIPLILQVALGKREHISIYGDDYPTRDGTCVRDYIHVCDLATAHVKAMEGLVSNHLASGACNLGTGQGYTVKEIIEQARKITGHPIPIQITARRPGDPAELVADASRAQNLLQWRPTQSDLATIIKTAWNWHSRQQVTGQKQ